MNALKLQRDALDVEAAPSGVVIRKQSSSFDRDTTTKLTYIKAGDSSCLKKMKQLPDIYLNHATVEVALPRHSLEVPVSAGNGTPANINLGGGAMKRLQAIRGTTSKLNSMVETFTHTLVDSSSRELRLHKLKELYAYLLA